MQTESHRSLRGEGEPDRSERLQKIGALYAEGGTDGMGFGYPYGESYREKQRIGHTPEEFETKLTHATVAELDLLFAAMDRTENQLIDDFASSLSNERSCMIMPSVAFGEEEKAQHIRMWEENTQKFKKDFPEWTDEPTSGKDRPVFLS